MCTTLLRSLVLQLVVIAVLGLLAIGLLAIRRWVLRRQRKGNGESHPHLEAPVPEPGLLQGPLEISMAVADHLAFASTHPVEFSPHHEIIAIRQRVERMRGRSVSGIDQGIREALNKARS